MPKKLAISSALERSGLTLHRLLELIAGRRRDSIERLALHRSLGGDALELSAAAEAYARLPAASGRAPDVSAAAGAAFHGGRFCELLGRLTGNPSARAAALRSRARSVLGDALGSVREINIALERLDDAAPNSRNAETAAAVHRQAASLFFDHCEKSNAAIISVPMVLRYRDRFLTSAGEMLDATSAMGLANGGDLTAALELFEDLLERQTSAYLPDLSAARAVTLLELGRGGDARAAAVTAAELGELDTGSALRSAGRASRAWAFWLLANDCERADAALAELRASSVPLCTRDALERRGARNFWRAQAGRPSFS